MQRPSESVSQVERPRPGFWRTCLDACVAIDTLYIAVAAVICLAAVVYAVVTLDATTLIFAVLGLLCAFVWGCFLFGIRSMRRDR